MSSKKVNIVIGKSERESVRGGVTERESQISGDIVGQFMTVFYSDKENHWRVLS